VEFLARAGAAVTVTDMRSARDLAPTLKSLRHLRGIRYVLGRHRDEDFLAADLIVKNPGVSPDSPYLRLARERGIPVTSDVGIFFRACPAPIIGVTGTRGKSTTTYLIWLLLKTKLGRRVHYGGNIRKSVLALLPHIKKNDHVVLELSSFQLQDLAAEKISPHSAVFTNLLRDHLNRHKDMREYADAKSVIFRFQKPGDLFFYNAADPAVRRLAARAPVRGGVRAVSPLSDSLGAAVDKNLGSHYRTSVALAVAVARQAGIPSDTVSKILRDWHGLPGRQEILAGKGGVLFVNDTTATIPDAAIAAIRRFRAMAGPDHRLILIAGGQDKKLDFRAMAGEIKKSVDTLVLLPGTATDALRLLLSGATMSDASDMTSALRTALDAAHKGDIVLLSPGAASFGLFLNEFDRGDQFVRAIALRRGKTKNIRQE
jgi:UDP-N-acetylmuramoylalanine--D-glutamate ligase